MTLDENVEDRQSIDLKNCELFWSSQSYSAYRLGCDLAGVEPMFAEDSFNLMKSAIQDPVESLNDR